MRSPAVRKMAVGELSEKPNLCFFNTRKLVTNAPVQVVMRNDSSTAGSCDAHFLSRNRNRLLRSRIGKLSAQLPRSKVMREFRT